MNKKQKILLLAFGTTDLKKSIKRLQLQAQNSKFYDDIKIFDNESLNKDIKNLIKNKNLIGLHSDTHPVNIFNLSYRKQYKDYKKNYDFLVKNFNVRTISMSHPFGRYNKDSIKVLKKLGIRIGFLSTKNKLKKSNLEISRVDHNYYLNKIK